MTNAASNKNIFFLILYVFCLVLLSFLINEAVGVRQLSEEYMIMKPELTNLHNKRPVFHGKEIKNCLPKGFRHASGPSRFVNNHILGEHGIGCSQDKHFKQP
ncbi:hypothetical protein EJD97_012405 [Solanum chilense]|uniref:Uncharacterized protein n=1 Tax=Solanum chilense TaxID=4083 RepID=A0A6N2BDH1_SOLCI|nr:hypothetical protein EJD97_012405 [Solanum chilense]